MGNISNFLKEDISIETFKEKIFLHITHSNSRITEYALSQEDLEGIENLVQEKYNTWQWNFGYSPAYVFETTLHLYKQILPVGIVVKNGFIQNIEVLKKTPAKIDFLKETIVGEQHEFESMKELIFRNNSILIENGLNPEELIDCLF